MRHIIALRVVAFVSWFPVFLLVGRNLKLESTGWVITASVTCATLVTWGLLVMAEALELLWLSRQWLERIAERLEKQ